MNRHYLTVNGMTHTIFFMITTSELTSLKNIIPKGRCLNENKISWHVKVLKVHPFDLGKGSA